MNLLLFPIEIIINYELNVSKNAQGFFKIEK